MKIIFQQQYMTRVYSWKVDCDICLPNRELICLQPTQIRANPNFWRWQKHYPKLSIVGQLLLVRGAACHIPKCWRVHRYARCALNISSFLSSVFLPAAAVAAGAGAGAGSHLWHNSAPQGVFSAVSMSEGAYHLCKGQILTRTFLVWMNF